MRILVAEDEHKPAGALKEGLQADSCSLDQAHTGEEDLCRVEAQLFDLVILEGMPADRSCVEILAAIRQRGFTMPVLMPTGRVVIPDRISGLNTDADNYLVQPFAFPGLLVLIGALFLRGAPGGASRCRIADLEIDIAVRVATRSGQTLEFIARAFDFPEYPLRRQVRVVSREMPTRDVWREAGRHTPLDNGINVHIARLRDKIDGRFEKKLVQMVRGGGFAVREACR